MYVTPLAHLGLEEPCLSPPSAQVAGGYRAAQHRSAEQALAQVVLAAQEEAKCPGEENNPKGPTVGRVSGKESPQHR